MGESTRPSSETVATGELAAWLALKDRALAVAAEGVTIADARLPDRPLIYANEGFERMTGYPVAEVLGRNCRFLQGPDTDPAAVVEIRSALSAGRECLVEILNYRKDRTEFWNRLSITPIRDSSGAVTHFVGIQSDVTARRRAEDGLRQSKETIERDLKLAARVQQALLPPPERRFRRAPDRPRLPSLRRSGRRRRRHRSAAGRASRTLSPRRERPRRRRRAPVVHAGSPAVDDRRGALLTERAGAARPVVPPSRVAERLNRQFPMDRTRQYFTLLYGVIDPSSGTFQYVTAGHPAPVLLPRDGPPVAIEGAGFPIGMIDDAAFEDADDRH